VLKKQTAGVRELDIFGNQILNTSDKLTKSSR